MLIENKMALAAAIILGAAGAAEATARASSRSPTAALSWTARDGAAFAPAWCNRAAGLLHRLGLQSLWQAVACAVSRR
jgi:hypothetical protein